GRGARLRIAASCFSIYAFEALKSELSKIESLQFIFTAPTFVPNEVTDRMRRERREFFIPKARRESGLYGTEFEIQLRNKLSPDLSQDNIAKIRELFPGCVTEARDEATGSVAVDFDQLRQELSDHIVDGPQERYRLDWPGKREALVCANAPIAKTLRPNIEGSRDFDHSRNIFIEGDNLEALKLIQETYLGSVKLTCL